MASEVFVLGLSWRTAPVALRERLAFRDEEIPQALSELLGTAIREAVVVSTCNRVEIYGATGRAAPASAVTSAAAEARGALARIRSVPAEQLSSSLYEYTEDQAVDHVFRVASALDSLVLGEAQILGQLKSAYGVSLREGAVGPILGRCLERAFHTAKRVRTETGIARGAANVSTVAVELAGKVFGELTGRSVLLVGAGKMSALAARHLRSSGASTILVTNRSFERAEELADQVDGLARPWDKLESLLGVADVVLSSTAAQQPLLTKRLFKRVTKLRRYRPLVVIDIAVPRDAEPEIGKLDGVYLFDIDDLEQVVAATLKDRAQEAELAQEIVQSETQQFRQWMASQMVVPTIRGLRQHFESIANTQLDLTLRGLEDKTPAQREQAVRRLASAIVNKLLHQPLTALRSSDQPSTEQLLAAVHELFDLPLEEHDNSAGKTNTSVTLADHAEAGKNRGS